MLLPAFCMDYRSWMTWEVKLKNKASADGAIPSFERDMSLAFTHKLLVPPIT
jgi:hypothetical protein